MAELDGRRIAAVFAADAAVESRPFGFAELNRHLHEFAHALGVELGERVELVNLCGIVRGQELASVVTRETEGHLR